MQHSGHKPQKCFHSSFVLPSLTLISWCCCFSTNQRIREIRHQKLGGSGNANGHIYFVGSDDVWKRPFLKWIKAIFTSSCGFNMADTLPLRRSYRRAACIKTLFSMNIRLVHILPSFTEPENSSLKGKGGGALHCLLMLPSRISTPLPN
jgi:hypothetical protein